MLPPTTRKMSKNNANSQEITTNSSIEGNNQISELTPESLRQKESDLEEKILKFEKEKQAFEAAKKSNLKNSSTKIRKDGQRGPGLSVFSDDEEPKDLESQGASHVLTAASASTTSLSKYQPTSLADAIALKRETKGSWFRSYSCLTSNETNELAKLGRKLINLPETLCDIASQGGKVFKVYNEELRAYWFTIRSIQTGLLAHPNKKGFEEANQVITETIDFLDTWLNTHCSPQQNLPGVLNTMAQIFLDPVVKFLLGEREASLLVVQIRSVGKKFTRLSCQSSHALHNWNHNHKFESKNSKNYSNNKRKNQDNNEEKAGGFKKMNHKDRY